MQYHSGRSLTITCVIVLVITTSSTNGFAIRNVIHLKDVPDLDTGESSLLEIKHNAAGTIHGKSIDDNQGTSNSVIALYNFTDIGKTSQSNKVTGKSTSIQNKPSGSNNQRESARHNKYGTDNTFSTISSLASTNKMPDTTRMLSVIPYNFHNTWTPTISAFGNSPFTTNNHLITKSQTNEREKNTNDYMKQETNTNKLTATEIVTSSPISKQFLITVTDDDESTLKGNHVVTSTRSLNVKDKINEINTSSNKPVYTTVDSLIERTLPSTIHNTGRSFKENPSTITEITSNLDGNDLSSKPYFKTEPPTVSAKTSYDRNNELSHVLTTEHNYQNVLTFEEIKNPTTTEFQITKTKGTDIIEDQYYTTLTPLSIYKDRKVKQISRHISDDTTSTKKISAVTSVLPLVPKVSRNTVTPPTLFKDQAKIHLHDLEHSIDKLNATTSSVTKRMSTSLYRGSSVFPTRANIAEYHTERFGIFTSVRAGYLDNSETTTSKLQETTTENYITEITNNTDHYANNYDTEVSDSDNAEEIGNRNTIAMESQSQLAEDAIKEELLIENTIKENELFKSRQRVIQTGNSSSVRNDSMTPTELVTEYLNNIITTAGDKRKTTALYTLSPNYKPPKKLEVLPTKPFARDPDDNSWRNESISSLGIVFNAKNPSKSFTEVLKNKTTELSNIVRNDYKNEVPDLRLRLEKMTEVRKSKKKRINKFGDAMYSDYEESSENTNYLKDGVTPPLGSFQESDRITTTPLPPSSSTEANQIANAITDVKHDIFRNDVTTPVTKHKTKKLYNLAEYYDTTDEYDADYAKLPKMDIKKFTSMFKNKQPITTSQPIYFTLPSDFMNTKPMSKIHSPDRQATVQYFPPTKKVTVPDIQNDNQKMVSNSFDNEFKNNMYWYDGTPKTVTTELPARTPQYDISNKLTAKPLYTPPPNNKLAKDLYSTHQSSTTELPGTGTLASNDGNYNRASYMIKHYGDFIKDEAKAIDEQNSSIFLPYTDPPMQGVTMNEYAKFNMQRESNPRMDYDYDTKFRKDIVNRFVDNFNEHSDRFKVDFPILYNSSVIHNKFQQNGKVLASSNAFMKRLHETRDTKSNSRLCDANCERMTIEISPSYELHYYVPEQEETEIMKPRTNTYPYRFTL